MTDKYLTVLTLLAIVLGSCSKSGESFCRTGNETKYKEKHGEILTFTYTDSDSIRFTSNKFANSEILFPYEDRGKTFNLLGRIIVKIENDPKYYKFGLECTRNSIEDGDLISCNLNNTVKYIATYSKSIGIKSIRIVHADSENSVVYTLESQYGLARICS
jgi:hypothetical protein